MSHIEAIRHVLRCYPNWACPAETAQTWALELAGLPAEAVYAAAKALCIESEYPPTLAAIHKRASILARPAGSQTATVAEAWDETLRWRDVERANSHARQWRRIGYEGEVDDRIKPVTWSSESVRLAAHAVNFAGDWAGESMTTLRAQFERYYREECERVREAEWAASIRTHVEETARLQQTAPKLERPR